MTAAQHMATAPAESKGAIVWTGRILSGLVVLFLLFDGAIKLVPLQVVTDTVIPLGWPTDATTWRALGIVLIASALLYAYPRTSVLGAILITAYLGGAVATHMRVGSPLFSHTLFGVYLGIILWEVSGCAIRVCGLCCRWRARASDPKVDPLLGSNPMLHSLKSASPFAPSGGPLRRPRRRAGSAAHRSSRGCARRPWPCRARRPRARSRPGYPGRRARPGRRRR